MRKHQTNSKWQTTDVIAKSTFQKCHSQEKQEKDRDWRRLKKHDNYRHMVSWVES